MKNYLMSEVFCAENEELYSLYCRPIQRDASIVVKRNKNDIHEE